MKSIFKKQRQNGFEAEGSRLGLSVLRSPLVLGLDQIL